MAAFPSWALPLLRCPHCGEALAVVPAAAADFSVGWASASAALAGSSEVDWAVGGLPVVGSTVVGPVPGARTAGASARGDGAGAPRAETIGCPAGHRFDVARQGYLPLLGPRGRTDTGDSTAMVQARERFLGAGHFAPIAEAVRGALLTSPPGPLGPVIEVGAGTAYYLAAVVGAGIADEHAIGTGGAVVGAVGVGRADGGGADRPIGSVGPVDAADAGTTRFSARGIALDSSKHACRRAAARPGLATVLADAWAALPLRSGVAAAVLSIFAPRDPAELTRVTAPGGRIVVVTPEPDHLAELRGPLRLLEVDAGKTDRLAEAFAGHAERVDRRTLRFALSLGPGAAADLAGMGPAARHSSAEQIAAAAAALPDRVTVTAAVTLTVLRRPL